MSIRTFLRFTLLLTLAMPLAGCATANSPTPPLAPGYNSPNDQMMGEWVAGINAFATHEQLVYNCQAPEQLAITPPATTVMPCLTVAVKAAEKTALNALILAAAAADSAYLQYHAGQATLAQVTAAANAATTAQSNLTTAKGVQ